MGSKNQPRQSLIPPQQQRMEIPNDRIRNHAQQYREVVEDLFYRPGGPNPNPAPLFTCCSLALELFLKALTAENVYEDLGARYGNLFKGSYQITARYLGREHKLSQIFQQVPAAIQQKLGAAFSKQPPFPGAATLVEVLTRYDHLFINSRYSYETDQLSFDGPINDLVRLVTWLGTQLEAMPREMIFDDIESLPQYAGRVVGDTIVFDSGLSLPNESTVRIEVADGSRPSEEGVVEYGVTRLDWSGSLPEGTAVVVVVTGRLLPIEEVDPAFKIGDRAVGSADIGSTSNGRNLEVEDQ